MSYRVRVDSFEGPFDLLLYLVSRQRIDVGSISINEITDQYLEELSRLKNVDLDVSSDFVLVASTLLELKAASLLPQEKVDISEEIEQFSPSEMRDALVQHLIEYKKFKNASNALKARFESQERLHFRTCGPDRSTLTLMPDFLQGVELERVAQLCAQILSERDIQLLQSEHIEEEKVSLEGKIKKIYTSLKTSQKVSFSELIDDSSSQKEVVATFLAVLELFKRSMVNLSQKELFGDIEISYLESDEEIDFDNETFDSVL
ncbi:MAG: segregation and condensation protein A [Anaerotardibacter sp.]